MILEKAIESVVGVTVKDMKSESRLKDVLYGRVLYATLSGLPRAEVARRLGKCFTTITYYQESYDWLKATDPLFRNISKEVEELI